MTKHKKSGSSCAHSRSTSGIPIVLNNIHQRRPAPKKPNETGTRVFFRLNLYQGPQSARVRIEDSEPEQYVPPPSRKDLGKSAPKAPKITKPKKEKEEVIPQTFRQKENRFMSRVDWIVRIKDIFNSLIVQFDQKVFDKVFIIKSIQEKEKVYFAILLL